MSMHAHEAVAKTFHSKLCVRLPYHFTYASPIVDRSLADEVRRSRTEHATHGVDASFALSIDRRRYSLTTADGSRAGEAVYVCVCVCQRTQAQNGLSS